MSVRKYPYLFDLLFTVRRLDVCVFVFNIMLYITVLTTARGAENYPRRIPQCHESITLPTNNVAASSCITPTAVERADANDSYRCTRPSRWQRYPSNGIRGFRRSSVSGRGLHTVDEPSLVVDTDANSSVRQLRLFARDACAKVPGVLHHYTSAGTIRPLALPQSACSGLLRRRCIPTVDVATTDDDSTDEIEVVPAGKRKRTTNTKSDRKTKPKSDQPRVRKPRAYKPRAYKPRVPNPNFTYPDADEMFLDVERELGLGEQEPFYAATGWCRPPADHPDFADWINEHPEDADLSQQERLVKENSSRASEFRKALQDSAPTVVCCVCSCFVCPSESQSILLRDVPGLQLLRKDTLATDQVPRSGHTYVSHDGVDYLLQPSAVNEASGSTFATICSPCHRVLKSGKIPKASLAAIDPGLTPATLPKLSIMEALIISPSRLHCHVLTLTPGRRHESHPERTEDSEGHKVDWTTASTGHTVAFRNPGPDAFVQSFPLHPDAIPSLFKVRVLALL